MKHWLHRFVPILLLAAALAIRWAEPGFVEQARMLVFDGYQRIQPREYKPAPVVILDIDDESLERLGQWPLPRVTLARLVERLSAQGAAAIAFDMVFAEPDRTSPVAATALWPESPATAELRALARRLPDHDSQLAQAIAGAPVVTGFAFSDTPGGPAPRAAAAFATLGDDPRAFLPSYQGALVNLPAISAAAAGNGSFNNLPEIDGVTRRLPLVLRLGEQLYPSLSIEALRVAQGAGTIVLKASGASDETALSSASGLNHIKVGAMVVPTDAHGRLWLYDSGPVAARFLPAWQVLEPGFNDPRVEGAIVLVGSSAIGLKDLRPTPLNQVAPGVEVHAQVMEQVIHGDFLERPDWAFGVELMVLLGLGVMLIFGLPRWGPTWSACLGGAAIVIALAGSWAAFTELRWLIDPVYPAIATVILYIAGSLSNFLKSEAERWHIRRAFGHYLAPSVVDRLVKDGNMPTQGGEMREMTIWISDLENYTTLSERLDPPEIVQVLNRVYSVMSDTVEEHGGFVVQFVGDAVVSAFGAPLDDPDHASHAVEAAIACQDRVAALSEQLSLPEGLALRNRIGVSTGKLLVGNIGSERRLNYTVVGDHINLASRLEGVNKIYGSKILVNEATKARCRDTLGFREVDIVQVKGREAPVRIYEPIGDGAALSADRRQELDLFARALAAFRGRRFLEAAEGFEELAERDPVAHACAARALEFAKQPPPQDWCGVNVLTSK